MVPKPALGLSLAAIRGGDPRSLADVALRAEAAGYDSVWSAEAWGSDAFTPLAYLAARTSGLRLGTAIAQMAARTPAATAMTVLTLQQLSEGRLILGLGASGPQVVEGWHGVPYHPPVQMTREYLTILRTALTGTDKLQFTGSTYQIPYTGTGATGQGRPLRTTMPPAPHTPLLVAAMGPKNVAMAVEHADGLLPYLWSPTRWRDTWGEALGKARAGFQVAPTVLACVGDDLDACRDRVRPRIALHIGGMGSRTKNFYASLVSRYGYADEVARIQDLYLGGQRAAACAAVPDELVDDLALVGPLPRVAEQLAAWRDSPVTTMILEPTDPDMLEDLAKIW
ncbi:LLM class F420-dependent oxidoreductase [Frankia sp. CNm7]|uniref:LLM class F420-dependent oxidoreductase n=1 Tax=Frankia nepalensis TaxID=1836974 RepID=A0A937RFK3_9ACTN|nr:LLM class F420-dependent oxidoreductase [Frankia nepalensis]MBL7501087.1 LLM class F420-dependent oxidoreductase [Frankia nepalensis]MBL7514724.1 LLM class F420-dependent oxidoreductase [Frankia nepalensis]MBL7524575.1 LLM class F420-dependent oxidoreductase [Frankia nepalensis]MBL7631281.1 LLM class F420-dependent oxidoreductase [Frankia nepalensis]